MSDEIDRLRAAMRDATPAPDTGRKTADLRLAQENFDRLQGSRARPRHSRERAGWVRLANGVGQMMNAITTRGGLAATTALVAVAAVLVVYQGETPTVPLGRPGAVADVAGDSPRERLDAANGENAAADPAPAPAPAQNQTAPTTEAESSGDLAVRRAEAPSAPDADTLFSDQEIGAAAMSASDEAGGSGDALGGLTGGIVATLPKSVAPAPPGDTVHLAETDTEAFANAGTNPLKVTATDPVSTFSIDVDTASWAVVRSSLMAGALPPRDAVRVEEMVNYFPYDYAAPEGPHPFRPTVSVVATPWNPDTRLIHIGIQGEMPPLEDRPPLNLVFLIDTSGSMQDANKLPLLKQSFRLMLGELRPEDQISIVTYAGSAGRVLDPTPASERPTILAALERLEAGGSTAGQEGLQQAYATAESMADQGEVTRVILATDGDFNVGLSDPDALKDFIADRRESGTYLSVLGFGRGNLDDATMQALAQNGNGQAAYIDTLSEARKVLVDQLTGALFPIADDVKIQMEFNPAEVAEYRLIGYETRALRREDFNNDRVDAGDIGAGHAVTALYEITPVGSPAALADPLRYRPAAETPRGDGELGYLKLRYKRPGETSSTLIETPIGRGDGAVGGAAEGDVAFAAAIAGFGQLLRDGPYMRDWSYDDAIALASGARGDDPYGYRAEAVTLMRLAETLAR